VVVQRNARFGGTGVVHRRKVKEIGTNRRRSAPTSTEGIGTNPEGDRHQPGTNLGMSKVAACEHAACEQRLANSFSPSGAGYEMCTLAEWPLARLNPPKQTGWSPPGGGWRSVT
jgi:hypothetical protein